MEWAPVRTLGAVIGLVTGAGTIVGWIVSTESPLTVAGKALGYAGMAFPLGLALFSFVAAVLPPRTLETLEKREIARNTLVARAFYFGFGCLLTGFVVFVGTDPLDGVWITIGALTVGIAGYVAVLLSRNTAAQRKAASRDCPDCLETIKAHANVCRYCGYRFAPAPPVPTESPARAPTPPPLPASPLPDGEAASEAPSEPGPLTSPSAR